MPTVCLLQIRGSVVSAMVNVEQAGDLACLWDTRWNVPTTGT